MLARLHGAGRMEALMAATQLAPLLVDFTLTVAVAVFVCTGSRASRLLGAFTALAGVWLLSTPFALGVPLSELLDALGPDKLSYLAAMAFQVATVVALALPLRTASPRRSGAMPARG